MRDAGTDRVLEECDYRKEAENQRAFQALFERMPVWWQMRERRPEFPRFFEAMIALRRDHPAKHGTLLELPVMQARLSESEGVRLLREEFVRAGLSIEEAKRHGN